MPAPSIAIRLQNARKTLGLSQKEAALEWGISKRTLQHWEQGQRHPSGLYLKLVSEILAKIECGNSHPPSIRAEVLPPPGLLPEKFLASVIRSDT